MDCVKCRFANAPGAAFCARCGGSLAPPPSFCNKCGTALAPGAGFCNGCGRDLATPFVPPIGPPVMSMALTPMMPPMGLMPLGGCPRCGSMYGEGYSTGIIICAVLFFPLGLLFLLARKEKRCLNGRCRLVF